MDDIFRRLCFLLSLIISNCELTLSFQCIMFTHVLKCHLIHYDQPATKSKHCDLLTLYQRY